VEYHNIQLDVDVIRTMGVEEIVSDAISVKEAFMGE